jgi:hypothetical protein
VLVALTATAAADPPARRAPSRACEREGDVMFESAVRLDEGIDPKTAKVPTQITRLWDTGGWSHDEYDGAGKLTASTTGCLSPSEVKPIHDELFAAKWTLHVTPVGCDAMSASHTEYHSYGKLIAADYVCPWQALDEASAKALADIKQRLATATAPKTPPCCKH